MNTTLTRNLFSPSFAPAARLGYLAAAPERRAPAPAPTAPVAALRTSIALPLPRTSRLERCLVAALALAAATALVQGLGVMLECAPPWDAFSAWVANVLL